jgi:hypothetical protein
MSEKKIEENIRKKDQSYQSINILRDTFFPYQNTDNQKLNKGVFDEDIPCISKDKEILINKGEEESEKSINKYPM